MEPEKPAELGYAPLGTVRRQPLVRWWVPIFGVVAGFIGVFAIANLWPHQHTVSNRMACASNLGHIGRSCLRYAEIYDGNLPTSLDVLTQGGRRALCLPKQLTQVRGFESKSRLGGIARAV
jgi:hypothetical protein